jgi:cytochrome c6
MKNCVRTQMALAILFSLAGAMSFAQSTGEEVYKAKCQMCHGANGEADTPTAKAMKVKPVSDPDIKKLTDEQMFDSTKNGKGKMPAYKDKLTDQQIKDSVTYYRSLK